MAFFMGIDVGTSSAKVVIIDETGAIRALQKREYDLVCERSGWSEQHPHTWWETCVGAIRGALHAFPHPAGEVRAIGVSNQMHSLVALDAERNCVRPSILHNDSRTSAQAQALRRALGERALSLTMNPIYTGMTLSSLLWIRDEEPANYARIAHVLLAGDYVRMRLTGDIATDHSNASATLAYDFTTGDWSGAILGAVGVPRALFPRCCNSTDVQGAVTAAAARETGLRPGTPVVFGGGDQVMQSIGSGTIQAGQATCNIGSGGQICVQTGSLTANPEAGVNTFVSYEKHKWYLMGANSNAGSAFKWLCQDILMDDDFDAINRAAARIAPGSDGLIFLPYLSGERCPHCNAHLSGAFFGLTHRTDRARMARATMEGITFSLLDCLDACRVSGASPASLVALGGGANSDLWLQMQADIFNLPIRTTLTREQAVLGAALTAAVGVSHFDSLEQAVGVAVRHADRMIEPDSIAHATYAEYCAVYRELYRMARPALERVTRLGRCLRAEGGEASS